MTLLPSDSPDADVVEATPAPFCKWSDIRHRSPMDVKLQQHIPTTCDWVSRRRWSRPSGHTPDVGVYALCSERRHGPHQQEQVMPCNVLDEVADKQLQRAEGSNHMVCTQLGLNNSTRASQSLRQANIQGVVGGVPQPFSAALTPDPPARCRRSSSHLWTLPRHDTLSLDLSV